MNAVENKTTSANIVNKEMSSFSVSSNILYSLIYQQAGSPTKALMELVMNEIDAKASKVSITISEDFKSLVVEGDGVGFTSREEIDKLFSCFGFDHDTEEEKSRDRAFGRYGLGRGQIFAFAATEWHTNQFKLVVDLKSKTKKDSLPFEINEFDESLHDGCKIFINLYEEMSLYERNNLIRDLKSKLKYISAPLILNGARLNKDVKEEKWSVETETLAFKAASASVSSGLEIYNKGVYVTTLSHRVFGVSGVVTSTTKAFDVNMARNDIQQATCALWKELKVLVKPFAEKRQREKLTNDDCVHLVQKLISGDVDDKTANAKIFTLVSGSKISLKRLAKHAKGMITASESVPCMVGEKIHREKLAGVISPQFIESVGYDSVDEFVSQIKGVEKSLEGRYNLWELRDAIDSLKVVEFKSLEDAVNNSIEIIENRKLSKLDKAKLHALKRLNTFAATITRQDERNLLVGKAETAEAWTDGVSYVAIEIDLLKSAFSSGHNSLIYVLNTLIHEYCHDSSSNSSHGHDDDFNARFRLVTESRRYAPFNFITSVLEMYFRARKREGIEQSSAEVYAADCELSNKIKKAAF